MLLILLPHQDFLPTVDDKTIYSHSIPIVLPAPPQSLYCASSSTCSFSVSLPGIPAQLSPPSRHSLWQSSYDSIHLAITHKLVNPHVWSRSIDLSIYPSFPLQCLMAALPVSSPISLSSHPQHSQITAYPVAFSPGNSILSLKQSSIRHFPRHGEYRAINTRCLHSTNLIS